MKGRVYVWEFGILVDGVLVKVLVIETLKRLLGHWLGFSVLI